MRGRKNLILNVDGVTCYMRKDHHLLDWASPEVDVTKSWQRRPESLGNLVRCHCISKEFDRRQMWAAIIAISYRQNSTLGRAVLLASCWMALPRGASWAPIAALKPEAVSSVSWICWQTALCSDLKAPRAFLVRSMTSWKSWSTWVACERVSRIISCMMDMADTRSCNERWTCSDASCTLRSLNDCHSVGVVCLPDYNRKNWLAKSLFIN